MSTEQPRHIGPYEIRETIGRGGMAAVYKAHQPSLDRVVAIKVISAHLASESEFMERFRQEALAVARLTHQNIVIVHDFGEDTGVPYLVMEYVDGVTLGDLLDEGIDQTRVDDLLTQVAAGLDYAHSRGVVHRDIKPQNVLVTFEGRAVLADFGLARMMESSHRLTMSGGVVGTPEYMSPEQAAGRNSDHRTDIYSLGVILYEMLAGVRPFAAETPLGVLMKHLQENPPRLREFRPDLPAAYQAVVDKALAKKPEERFQKAGELARAFREAVNASAAGSSPAAPVAETPAVNAAPPVSPPPAPAGELDMSRYAGLKQSAQRAVKPHQTPSMVDRLKEMERLREGESPQRPAPAPGSPGSGGPAQEPTGAPPRPGVRTCPSCHAEIPSDASICPNCMYMLPFEEVAKQPVRREPIRQTLRLNLLPHNCRWDPPGLDRARKIAQQQVNQYLAQGWELVTPLEASGTFVQGRTAAGPVVQSAIITLQRFN